VGPAESLARFLRALGVPDEHLPHDIDERAALYRSLLARRRMLVLLDNAAAADQVRPLLPGAGDSVALVTSRGDLAGLVALDGAHQIELGPLPGQESVALLARVLGEPRVRAEPDAAVELARLCGHLPLALRIAAADLAGRPDRTLADAAALLSADRLTYLEVPGDAAAAVRGSFDISYHAQSPEARRVFRLLGLVPGADISTVSAAALADAPVRDTARALADLARGHLIHQVAPDRFALHDLLGAYAADQAEREDGPDDRTAALTRLYEHYLFMVDSAAGVLYPEVLRLPPPPPETARDTALGQDTTLRQDTVFREDTDASAWLDAERENLVAAVQRGAAHGPKWTATRIADGLRGYFSMRMSIVDWLAAAGAALEAAEADADIPGEAATRLSLAWLNYRQSRHEVAVAHGTRALECSQEAGWRQGEAAAYGLLGSACMISGMLAAAAEHSLAALELNRESGNLGGQAVHLSNLGSVHSQLGRLAESAEYQAQAVDLYRKVHSRRGEALSLAALGECDHGLGELQEAETHLTAALAIQRDIGDRLGEAYALQVLAAVRRDAGETGAARELGVVSLGLARELGHRRLEASALIVVGTVDCQLARYRQAAHAHRDALRLAGELGERHAEVEALVGLTDAQLGLGRHERALAFAVQALTLARQAGYAVQEANGLTVLARIHLAAGDRDRAAADAQRAVEIHDRAGHRLGRAHAQATLSEATAARPTGTTPG
jgi:tetratricopeptide (TPR) repeat protein